MSGLIAGSDVSEIAKPRSVVPPGDVGSRRFIAGCREIKAGRHVRYPAMSVADANHGSGWPIAPPDRRAVLSSRVIERASALTRDQSKMVAETLAQDAGEGVIR